MPNIVLTRIDNRLIHGQVATMWSSSVGANLLLVANDEVCTNEFRQGLMDMAAPSFAQTRYFSIEKTINIPNDCICCGIDGMYPYPITNTNVVTPNSIYIFPISFFLNKSIIVNTRYKELKKLTKLTPFTYP